MIRAVIIDDETNARNVLKRILLELDSDVVIVNEANGVVEGVKLINKEQPDIVFLDIEMLDGTGFNVLERVNNLNFKVIFVTAYDQYAIKAFKFNAIDYLLKPLDVDEVENAIDKAKNLLNDKVNGVVQLNHLLSLVNKKETNDKIAIRCANRIDFIEIKNIVCLLADSSYTEFYMSDKQKLVSSKPLKFYESLFEDEFNFFKMDRGTLININYIKSYIKDKDIVELETDIQVPLARRRKKEFLDLINF